MKKLYATLFGTFIGLSLFAQVSVQSSTFNVQRTVDFTPREIEPSFNARITSLEAPDAMHWRSQLNEIKKEAAERFTEVNPLPDFKRTAPQPALGWGTEMYRVFTTIGTTGPLYAGIPNDNALAISNGGMMLGAVNSFLWAYDIPNDTVHIVNSYVNLDNVGPDAGNDRGFDPKLMYDEDADRFILVFLKNNLPSNSKIAVCFSSTNDPNDPWYTYILPGNPLNNNRWTDFPAMSITEDHLYITGNLIIPNVSWQVGFDGSIIWQLDKKAGFAGDTVMPNRLHHDIKFGNRFIRNLHCVKGYNGEIDTAYFLSNRNFDIQNDSIFVLSLHSNLDEPEDLRIRVRQSDTPYGVPPNGRQQDTDPNDPTDGLQTNDGRVLGAIRMPDGNIQFVSTTRNFTNQRAAIYHGTIFQPGSSQSSITATVIGDAVKDYGYPNLTWTGNEECDNEVIIGFNHTSPTDFAGMSAIYYSNEGDYSDVLQIKAGEGYVQRLTGGDRWGDYFGIQTQYNRPGKVYVGGFMGTSTRSNTAYFAELTSPDSTKLELSLAHNPSNRRCSQVVDITPSGGVTPYSITVNGQSSSGTETACGGDTLLVTVVDDRGCELVQEYVVPFEVPNEAMTYPNPTTGFVGVVFDSPREGNILARISDINGKEMILIEDSRITGGKHYLEFDLATLASGVYVLEVIMDEEAIYTERIVKH
ncbi:MAG: T9SS type A sorting domain-containing protein [Flavobacteriia bacterium]|nr:T9SS type A sorting domain-containing protein [Flavobacteriia bacterium]